MKKRRDVWKITRWLGMTLGCFIYALGISLMLDPNSLAPGGVSGISIILSKLTAIQTGTWVILINIPIIVLGIWKLGWKFIVSTLYCTFASSLMMNWLSVFPALTEDMVLAALVGGAVMALGLGIVFRCGSTTGGADIIVKIIRQKCPHLKMGNLILATDTVVILLSAIVFGDIDKALYAGIAVFVESVVLDLVLYGRDEAKLIYIISDCSEQIATRILQELDVGVTYVRGNGAYSGREKKVIMCVVKKQIAPRAEDIVKEEDPGSFMIVTSATEIFGEGYKNILGERI